MVISQWKKNQAHSTTWWRSSQMARFLHNTTDLMIPSALFWCCDWLLQIWWSHIMVKRSTENHSSGYDKLYNKSGIKLAVLKSPAWQCLHERAITQVWSTFHVRTKRVCPVQGRLGLNKCLAVWSRETDCVVWHMLSRRQIYAQCTNKYSPVVVSDEASLHVASQPSARQATSVCNVCVD